MGSLSLSSCLIDSGGFGFQVWLWFILSFFAVILVLAAMALYEQRMNPAEEQKTFWELFGSNAIYVFTVLIGQGALFLGFNYSIA